MSIPITSVDVWADGGSVVAPDPAKISVGWVPGDQPPAQWHNWLFNKHAIAINACITEHNLGITFEEDSEWYDTSSLASSNHNDAINEIVDTLAAKTAPKKIGSDEYYTPRRLGDMSIESLETKLQKLADAIDLNGMATAQTYPEGLSLVDMIKRRYDWSAKRGSGWAQMWANGNTLELGEDKNILDLDFAIVEKTDKEDYRLCIVLLVEDTNSIEIYDAATLGFVASSGDLDTGAEGWEVRTMVSNGSVVFVSLEDPTAGSLHRVQAFEVYDRSFGLPSGWGATGIALPSSGASLRDEMLIVPTTGDIAHLNSWVASATPSGTTPYVSIIAEDMSAIASGAGDATGAGGLRGPTGGLVADNVALYFSTSTAAAVTEVNTATIANLTTGLVGSWPFSMGGLADVADFVSDGEHIITVWQKLDQYAVRIHKLTQPDYTGLDFSSFETDFDPMPGRAVCDGRNLWIHCNEEDGVTPNQRNRLYQFDLSRIIEPDSGPAPRDIAASECFVAKYAYDDALVVDQNLMGAMGFDGRDIWAVWNNTGLISREGIIRRLPRAGIR